MNTVIYMAGALATAALGAALARRRKFVVPEGHYGLLNSIATENTGIGSVPAGIASGRGIIPSDWWT